VPKNGPRQRSDCASYARAFNHLIKNSIVKMNTEIKNNVLIGLDSNLFLFDGGQKSFAYSTGELKPNDEDVEIFFKNIESRKKILSSKNIPFLHILFPSKEVFLKEKVPEPWRSNIKGLYFSHFERNNFDGTIIYPFDLLKNINKITPAYRTLDTHMCDAGAIAVAMHILNKFGEGYETSEFFANRLVDASGDLARMINSNETRVEECLINKFHLKYFDNRASLPGNTNNICILHNKDSLTKKRILIFGDSFIQQTLRFLSPVFRDVVYVRSATFQPDMVELMSPDIVISSTVERYLCQIESDENSKSMLFTHYGKDNYSPPTSFSEAYKAQFSYRHHKSYYNQWIKKLIENEISFDILGIGHPNNHLKIINKSSFEAIDRDPQLLFPYAKLDPDKIYSLEATLESDVDSCFVIYYQVEGDEKFSESKSIRNVIKKGMNNFKLNFPELRLGNRIRIDPIACTGKFRIINLDLINENCSCEFKLTTFK